MNDQREYGTKCVYVNTVGMGIVRLFILCLLSTGNVSATGYISRPLSGAITGVQPFTGIVFWSESEHSSSSAIQLEFSYMLYNTVVKEKGVYNWEPVDSLLDKIASRKHQAILRFRDTYPGYATAVPDYIKNLAGYQETEGVCEGRKTFFPDWRSDELQRFTLEFFAEFAGRYDTDPRLAYLQAGFGLWAEYHIYDGPCELGRTFPDKTFQSTFFRHLDTLFIKTPWNVSIDAADGSMTPLASDKNLTALRFGLFDDSFLCEDHGGYNTDCWNFFGRNRYLISPAGGEISYYTDTDQRDALAASGPHGVSFETAAKAFHISYMIGNDQPEYQTLDRIKNASMACGYAFRITACSTTTDSAIVSIKNTGVAPLYFDAYVAVNGVRSSTSLRLLAPDSTRICKAASGGASPKVSIDCDRLVPGQKIEYAADLQAGTAAPPAGRVNMRQPIPAVSARWFLINGKQIGRRTLTGKKLQSQVGRGIIIRLDDSGHPQPFLLR